MTDTPNSVNEAADDDISAHDLQVAMTLCSLTYLDEADNAPVGQRRIIREYLARPTLPMGGSWKLVWGPGSNELNLWYIAQEDTTGNLALVIRGTVMSSTAAELGDLDIKPVPPLVVGAPADVTVARGIATAHGHLNAATDPWSGLTAWQFLAGALAGAPTRRLDVIGHSLGGALAPVVSMDAMRRFPQARVRSFPFAGMSPGNQAFSDWYVGSLRHQTHSRFINPLDIIPQWYAGLHEMRNGFPDGGAACPLLVRLGLDALIDYMAVEGIHYVATPNAQEFVTMQYTGLSWTDQCHAQHEHRYYMLMTGMSFETIEQNFPIPTPQWLPPGWVV